MGTPEAGWYEDPSQPDRLRYWDGTWWTDRTTTASPGGPLTSTASEPSDVLFLGTGPDDGRTFVCDPSADEGARIDALLAIYDDAAASTNPSPIGGLAVAEVCRDLRHGGRVSTPHQVPPPAPGRRLAPLPLPYPLVWDEPQPPVSLLRPWWQEIHPAGRDAEDWRYTIRLDDATFRSERLDGDAPREPAADQHPGLAFEYAWSYDAEPDLASPHSSAASLHVSGQSVVVACVYTASDALIDAPSRTLGLI